MFECASPVPSKYHLKMHQSLIFQSTLAASRVFSCKEDIVINPVTIVGWLGAAKPNKFTIN